MVGKPAVDIDIVELASLDQRVDRSRPPAAPEELTVR
jgi:hypothetical protein